jgi:hypothetical protein
LVQHWNRIWGPCQAKFYPPSLKRFIAYSSIANFDSAAMPCCGLPPIDSAIEGWETCVCLHATCSHYADGVHPPQQRPA